MNTQNDLNVIFTFRDGKIVSLPYFDSGGKCSIDVTWNDKEDPDEIWIEEFKNMLDYWPEIFEPIRAKVGGLEWDVINYINSDLRILLELPSHKEVSHASFVIFKDREDPLKQVGVVMSATDPNERFVYEFNVDNYPIATIAHIDFDKYKQWPQKKNESIETCIKRMTKGTCGNVGQITHCDRYEILVHKSKHGMTVDFLNARMKYLEILLENEKHKNEKTEKTLTKIYSTVIGDFGYDASRFLDSKFKSTRHRPTTPFADDLFKILKNNCTTLKLDFKRKGRYYNLNEIPILKAGKIFDSSHLLVTFNTDPIHELYMDKICLKYCQINHRLTLKFQTCKRTMGPDNEWIYN